MQSQSTPANVSSAHRSSQSQSVISVDETVPYSRGVDRTELLSSKSPSLWIRLPCGVVMNDNNGSLYEIACVWLVCRLTTVNRMMCKLSSDVTDNVPDTAVLSVCDACF